MSHLSRFVPAVVLFAILPLPAFPAALHGRIVNSPSDTRQVYDSINTANSEDIVSTSYGLCEQSYTAADNGGHDHTGIPHALHDTFLQGNFQGITYTVSSGDEAGRPCPPAAYFAHPFANKSYAAVPSVDMPASDPNVVAVGGGNLTTGADPIDPHDLNATYISENASADPEPAADTYGIGNVLTNRYWGAGGGQSSIWPKPNWQKGKTPGATRSVPDIGSFVGGCFSDSPTFVQPCADDISHALEVEGGELYEVIGTRVAAPEFAALLASIEASAGSAKAPGTGRLGNANPYFYSLPAAFFRRTIPGSNGVVSFSGYDAWNPSYGLGSIFAGTPFRASAGTPQTASHPEFGRRR